MKTIIHAILTKIRNQRKEKGLSLENMADELHISTSAYRKIENNQCKLTIERLIQIAAIFEIPTSELLDKEQRHIYNKVNKEDGIIIGHQKSDNFYQKDKEITQKLIESLQDEIAHLKSEINFLRALVKLWFVTLTLSSACAQQII